MLTRTVTGALLALISFAFIPAPQDTLPKPGVAQQISAVQSDLADTVDQMAKMSQLSRSFEGMQQQQNEIVAMLDDLSAQIRKSSTAKYVTRTDLDDAIATTKECVEKAKSFSSDCDCDCQSKIADLEKRIEALEAKLAEKLTSPYSAKSGGSNGSVGVNQSYTTQSVQTLTTSGGCTGKTSSNVYSTCQPTATSQPTTSILNLPDRTRTVKVIEPATRRQVTFAEVPEDSDLSLAVQSNDGGQCFTDENGNRVCPQSAQQSAQPVRATTRAQPKLGSRLRSIFGK